MPVALSTQNIQTLRRGLRNLFGLPPGLPPPRGPAVIGQFLSGATGGVLHQSSAKGSDSSSISLGGGGVEARRELVVAAAAGAVRAGAATGSGRLSPCPKWAEEPSPS